MSDTDNLKKTNSQLLSDRTSYNVDDILNEDVQPINKIINLDQEVVTAGRLIAWRHIGKIVFGKLSSIDHRIQIVLKDNQTKNFTQSIQNIHKDCIVLVKGRTYNHKSIKNNTTVDNFSISVDTIHLLTKPTNNLPNKRDGLQDIEQRRRLRIIEYITNQESARIIHTRHKLTKFLRHYLDNLGLTEVETPVLESVASGAAANPFKTFYNNQNRDLYLRIAPEFPLKKFIVAGFNGVYEIAKCFRNEGVDPTHLPEFTMLEFYIPYINYQKGRNIIIDLLQQCFYQIHQSLKTDNLDFSHIPQIDYRDFLHQYGLPRNIWSYNEDELRQFADSIGFDHKKHKNKQSIIDKLYKQKCLKQVINPILVYNYPNKPLAKPLENNPGFFKAFQVVIQGQECVNAYAEENNVSVLTNEFDKQEELERNTKEEEIIRRDNSFLEIMSYGMAPTVGFGIGLDRLLAIITNQSSLRDCITFPLLQTK